MNNAVHERLSLRGWRDKGDALLSPDLWTSLCLREG